MAVGTLASDVSLKLAAFLAALTAITAEDIQAIQKAGVLGDDVTQNITNLQNLTQSIDADTVNTLNDARVAAGLPAL